MCSYWFKPTNAQADRQATDARIEKEQERVDRALQAAREAGDKERELRDMATQLDALQVRLQPIR